MRERRRRRKRCSHSLGPTPLFPAISDCDEESDSFTVQEEDKEGQVKLSVLIHRFNQFSTFFSVVQ